MRLRLLALALAAGLAFGCGTLQAFTPPNADTPSYKIVDARFGGKGHLAIEFPSGIKVKLQQDGASEGLVSMFTGLISSAAGVFGGNPAPPEITINVPSTGSVPAAPEGPYLLTPVPQNE